MDKGIFSPVTKKHFRPISHCEQFN